MQLDRGMLINFIGRRLKTNDDVKLRLFEAELQVKITITQAQSFSLPIL